MLSGLIEGRSFWQYYNLRALAFFFCLFFFVKTTDRASAVLYPCSQTVGSSPLHYGTFLSLSFIFKCLSTAQKAKFY